MLSFNAKKVAPFIGPNGDDDERVELLFKNIFIFWVLYPILDLNFDLTGHGNPTKHTAISLQMCVMSRSLNSLRLYIHDNGASFL